MPQLEFSDKLIEENYNNFDNILKNESKKIKLFVDKILKKLNPDIIFIEKTINQRAFELLSDAGVAIVCKIKNNLLKKI